jgi:hypothetical protein
MQEHIKKLKSIKPNNIFFIFANSYCHAGLDPASRTGLERAIIRLDSGSSPE